MISCEPLVTEIDYQQMLQYVTLLQNTDNFIFLDSASTHPHLGRYSFIAFDPFATLIYQDNQILFNHQIIQDQTIFDCLVSKLRVFKLEPIPHLPPFQGGVAGFFSYDFGRDLEKISAHAVEDQQFPRLALGFYDVVLAFDHLLAKAWMFSSGLPEAEYSAQQTRARERTRVCLQLLANIPQSVCPNVESVLTQHDIVSNFSKSAYINMIAKAKNYILSGDIFEVNVSQRFSCSLPPALSPFDLYLRIRAINPAPFSSYVRIANTHIISSSPERFLLLNQQRVEARPIKGTVKRSKNILKDEQLKNALQTSIKDNAENTMIVDLMRNDLSKVCLPHSIAVPQYCQVESYETVHHLVSVIEGRLDPKYTAIDLLRATFPGGSITGAPKIRAMEIIDELEPNRRGPYCGSVGYIGFDGCLDTSILIRSYVIKDHNITFQTGGAVVLDSNPEYEYAESLLKANVLIRALTEKISYPTENLV